MLPGGFFLNARRGMLFLFEQRIEVFPQLGRRLGSEAIEHRKGMAESSELPLAVGAMRKVLANLRVDAFIGAVVEQFGKNFSGA